MDTSKKLNAWREQHRVWWWITKIVAASSFVIIILFAVVGVLLLSSTPLGTAANSFMVWLLAGDKPQVTWYITRAAGLTAYLLLWLSTAYGLAVPSRILDGMLHGSYTFEFHQFISLLAIGFTILHVVVLMFDQYAPFSLVQVLVPFLSTYRPGWVGVGILGFYIVLLVTITFYIRDRIGMKTFRAIHLLSLLSFVGAAIHGFFAGTDSPLPGVTLMYVVTFLSVVFLTTYWLIGVIAKKRGLPARSKTANPVPTTGRLR